MAPLLRAFERAGAWLCGDPGDRAPQRRRLRAAGGDDLPGAPSARVGWPARRLASYIDQAQGQCRRRVAPLRTAFRRLPRVWTECRAAAVMVPAASWFRGES